MEYLKYTPEMARDWKNATNYAKGYLHKRVLDSMNESQLVSKMWLVQELLNLNIKPINISLLAGWFAQYTVPLLIDNFKTIEWIENFEMDRGIKDVAYKFNKRYKDDKKYKVSIKNVMFDNLVSLSAPNFDTVINCSCEHMYPMSKFRELSNNGANSNALYVLQSSNDTQYDDHINCVEDADELAEQANLMDVMYAGERLLANGMTRFMVIGK
tara:strand:+ start:893 stop:1531 length:639 start_codon:yes stop_codon:yes gene_type:complete